MTRRRQRQCPRCGFETDQPTHCGVSLKPKRFKLTADKIKALRALAHGRKGLTAEEYHLRLEGVLGIKSTKDIRRGRDYYRFLADINALPDVPGYRERRAA